MLIKEPTAGGHVEPGETTARAAVREARRRPGWRSRSCPDPPSPSPPGSRTRTFMTATGLGAASENPAVSHKENG
jgi:hypothetical protein